MSGLVVFAKSDDFGYFDKGNEASARVLEYGSDVDPKNIVPDIYDVWDNDPDMFDCLFLVAHGNAGVLSLGSGIGRFRAAHFALLRGTFMAGARGIEIHGCACASSTDISRWHGEGTASATGPGYEFLASMAKHSGVKITAPVDSISGYRAAYSYDGGRTMTVYPTGSCYFSNYKKGAKYA